MLKELERLYAKFSLEEAEYDAGSRRIQSEEDISKIKYPSEQEFARLLLRKNPHLTVIYEPRKFEHRLTAENTTKATLPDFLIINPNNSNKPVYVEITCSERGNQHDVKARQKMVMKNAAPDVRYVVLYQEQLAKMQRKNPEFNPFRKSEFKT